MLAAAGVDSRRKCEELILTGRVEVDRQVVRELGTRVDASRQEIRVDGQVVRLPRLFHYAVYKPPGVVSTSYDRAGRARVVDLVPSRGARLFTIGRLDLKSEGLILVTNDGRLADLLTHPRYGVPKHYRVLVAGRPEPDVLRRLRRGVHLAEGVVRADQVRIRSHHKQSTVLEIVLSEGRNRELRRMLARLGHKVMKLVRVAVGPVHLGRLAPGEYRPLGAQEIAALRAAAGASGGSRATRPRRVSKATARGAAKKGAGKRGAGRKGPRRAVKTTTGRSPKKAGAGASEKPTRDAAKRVGRRTTKKPSRRRK